MAKKLGNSRISRVKILGILEFLKIPPNPGPADAKQKI